VVHLPMERKRPPVDPNSSNSNSSGTRQANLCRRLVQLTRTTLLWVPDFRASPLLDPLTTASRVRRMRDIRAMPLEGIRAGRHHLRPIHPSSHQPQLLPTTSRISLVILVENRVVGRVIMDSRRLGVVDLERLVVNSKVVHLIRGKTGDTKRSPLRYIAMYSFPCICKTV
jgi:hypothetical protein